MLLGLTLGLVEGATAAVLIKHSFAQSAAPWLVNLAVAFVSGVPALSNVVSFIWANIAHGRRRVGMVVSLQALFAISVGAIGLAPRAAGGLAFTVFSVLLARMLWAGVLTARTSIWTANYPRHLIARMTGRIVIVSSLALAAAAALAGVSLQRGWPDPRWLYGGAAIAGLCGAWHYRAVTVRREFQLLSVERDVDGGNGAFSLSMLTEILRTNPSFREYMFWMGLFGGGSLMLTSQLVVILSDQMRVPSGTQVWLLAVVPLLTLPLAVPMWARFFDGAHVVVYRSRQGWALVVAITVTCVAVLAGWTWLLWLGAALLGISYAGANLGWNLGHNDFATPGRAQHYMGVHVTLTGVRGVIAPPCGIAAYQLLETLQFGAGRWSMLIPLAMTTAGALGFNLMRRKHFHEQGS